MLAWGSPNVATANIEHTKRVRWERRSRVEQADGVLPARLPALDILYDDF